MFEPGSTAELRDFGIDISINKEELRQVLAQAIYIVRGYRTISYASASVLAASPPYELQALALRRVYEYLRDLDSDGLTPSIASRSAQDVRTEANLETWER